MSTFQWILAVDTTFAVVAMCAWVNAWIEWLGKDTKDGD